MLHLPLRQSPRPQLTLLLLPLSTLVDCELINLCMLRLSDLNP